MIKNIFRLFAFILFTSNSTAQIEQVEPPNWWIGMKNQNLQLLIHGNLVGETIPVINYPGVVIKKINKADSKNYLFIDLLIAKNTNPGIFDINFKKEGKIIYSHKYSLLVRSQDAAQIKGFNSSDVIYLITPDRFANGDYSNDVVAGMKENKINRYNETSRHGGDLRGIINHLDYISEMGFTAIWPTPVLENNMPASSYHGYAITNRYKVDPRFGTLEEYKELAEKAKQKGIKLIFDDVINHTGAYYWWMSDLPFKNWINNPDSFQLSNHRRTVNQDKYASSYDRDLLINGWFDKSMPDLNGQNPFMANYLIQSSIWWIETLQLGGIRQDTYPYSDKMFSKNWSCSITNEYPNFNIVGEEWSYNPLITSYWQQGKKNEDGYISCLKSVMDFALQSALIQALKEPEGPDFSKGLTKLYEGLANDFAYANPKSILIMGDNHDMDRIFTQLNKDVELTKMALTYLLTVRGIPQLYYGTELLMDNSTRLNNHGYIRSDFPGGWKEDKTNGFTGTGLSPDQLIFRGYLKKLLNWRKNNPVIANGETLHFAPFNGVYVYFRFTKEKTIMVVLNKNNNYTTIDTKRFNEILKNKTTAVNVMSGENVSLKNSFTVKGKTAAIYAIK